MIEKQAGGPPSLPAGQQVVGYLSPTAAQLKLPDGRHAVVESTQPMAKETSPGHFVPLDLGLSAAGDVYESVRPVVGTLIPKKLSEGIALPEAGISLTPVDAQGAPLEGEGTIDGASVLYTNTQTSTDLAVKPTTLGVEASAILRSPASPRRLYFRVSLPPGGRLVQSAGASLARVVQNGRTIALVRPPSATDAEGIPVPVSMSTIGDLLTVTVSTQEREYRWPLEVDPELAKVIDPTSSEHSNWLWHANQESKFTHHWETNTLTQYNVGGSVAPGEYTDAEYLTQGESKIYEVEIDSAGTVRKGRAKLELDHAGGVEQKAVIAENASYGTTPTTLCASAGCPISGGGAGNLAAFKLEATEPLSETYRADSTSARNSLRFERS